MLTLRPLRADDEQAAMRAHQELLEEEFKFLIGWDGECSFDSYLQRLERQQRGEQLPPGQVPATFLVAEMDGRIVGRVSIRHELNDRLRHEGGHVGFGIRPSFRRRGYATEALRSALARVAELGVDEALVTCDDNNVPSWRVIERCGGRLADVTTTVDGRRIRRYWIATP